MYPSQTYSRNMAEELHPDLLHSSTSSRINYEGSPNEICSLNLASERVLKQTISARRTPVTHHTLMSTLPPPPPPNPPPKKANKISSKTKRHTRFFPSGKLSTLQHITTKEDYLEASSSREDDSSGSSHFGPTYMTQVSPRSVLFEDEFHSNHTMKNFQHTINNLEVTIKGMQQQQEATDAYLSQLFEQINMLHNQIKEQNDQKNIIIGQVQQLSTQNYVLQEANKSLRRERTDLTKCDSRIDNPSLKELLRGYLSSDQSNTKEHIKPSRRHSLSESEIVSVIAGTVEEDHSDKIISNISTRTSKAKSIQSKLYNRILENVLNDLEAEAIEDDCKLTAEFRRKKIRDWKEMYQVESESIEDYSDRVYNTYHELIQNDVEIGHDQLRETFIMGLGPEFSPIQILAQSELPQEWRVDEFEDLVKVAKLYLQNDTPDMLVEEEEPTTIRMLVRSLI